MRRFVPLASLVVVLLAVFVHPVSASSAPCRPGSGPNLRGRNLTNGVTLPRDLRCANLYGAKLDEVDLTQHDLTGANLRNASLKEADLTQAYVEYADLRGANLTGADLGQLRGKKADLRDAIMVDVEAGQAEFPGADLTKADMQRGVFTQGNFTAAKLIEANLNDATLGQIKARKAQFNNAKMHEAKLGQATLQFAVFDGADLREAEFTQAELDDATFVGADVTAASFIQADDLNLSGAKGAATDVPTDAVAPPAGEVNEAVNPVPSIGAIPETISKRTGLSTAVVLILIGGLGLSLTLIVWGVSHRGRERRNRVFVMARHAAEEDVTRFGEEIDTLDFEMKVNAVSGPSHDWRAALDAYDAAKQALMMARTPGELHAAANAVQHGRQALFRVRSSLSRGF